MLPLTHERLQFPRVVAVDVNSYRDLGELRQHDRDTSPQHRAASLARGGFMWRLAPVSLPVSFGGGIIGGWAGHARESAARCRLARSTLFSDHPALRFTVGSLSSSSGSSNSRGVLVLWATARRTSWWLSEASIDRMSSGNPTRVATRMRTL